MEDKKNFNDIVSKKVEEAILNIATKEIRTDNIDNLGKLVDIHKDIANEEYWKIKEEDIMRYRNYGNDSYGRRRYRGEEIEDYGRRSRDSRGRYMEDGSYGRRGVDSKYRGNDMIDEMYGNYEDYCDNKEEYSRGNYGAKEDTTKSLEYMLQSVVDFLEYLKTEANTQEEINLIRKYAKKISEI